MFGKSIFKSYSGFINLFSRFSDPFMIVIAAHLAYNARFSYDLLDMPKDYRILVVFSFLCVAIVFPLFNLYSSWRGQSILRQMRTVLIAWAVVVLVMIVLLFGLKISSEYSRLWLAWWAGTGLVLLLFMRFAIYGVLQHQRSRGRNIRHVVVVGAGDLGKKALTHTKESTWMGFKIEALFDDDVSLLDSLIDGYKVVGGISDLATYVNQHEVDEVWIALPLRAEERVKTLLYDLRHETVNIKLIPDIFGFSLLNHSMTEIAGLPAVNLSETPMGGVNQLVKALEDRVLALFISVLILPAILSISILIKLTSSGPVLFKQKRHGWDGRIINVYKFRTMKSHNELGGNLIQATHNDSRVTKLGAFLRKTSLDELPQFYNVLQGRMSIVGPRPHAVEHNELYKDQVNRYMLRHMVKPGITGWAQINGLRGETDTLDKMEKRVEYDLYYIENWSLWFDLKIIFLTIFKGFVHKNAY